MTELPMDRAYRLAKRASIARDNAKGPNPYFEGFYDAQRDARLNPYREGTAARADYDAGQTDGAM